MRYPRPARDRLTGWPARLWKAAWPAGVVLGLGAEWLARSGQSLPAAGADLAVGWTLLGCGLLIYAHTPRGSVGPLLALAGLSWFLGTLAGSRIGAVAVVGSALLFLHRGPLCHAIIGYPAGRRSDRVRTLVLIVCYVYAAVVPLARNDVVTIIIACLVVAVTTQDYARAVGPDRRARVTAVAAAVLLAIPLAGGSLVRLMAAPGSGLDQTVVLSIYETVLIVIALGFLTDFLLGRWTQAAVTKLVIDLGGEAETGTLRTRLAHALGDRSLAIAYWLPEQNEYVDDLGSPVELPPAGSGRAVTIIEHAGDRIAALVHDAAVLDDPNLVDSVALAARIALSTVRMQADMQRRVAELDSSRRRILEAGDAQRRRLQQRLQASAGQRLAHVRQLLDLAVREAQALPDETMARGLQAARRDLEEAQADLGELARGIHPAMLTERGLGPALASLAERAPVPVRLVTTAERLPAVIETAVYFVCSEALANVAKHSGATGVDIQVRVESGTVTVLVADDGIGGADPSAGSGLNGAGDRIGALGGRLVVESPSGGGTRLLADIPAATPSIDPARRPPVTSSP
jgi:signal transduction histidine kinase